MITDFLVLFREPDGRSQPHSPAFTERHQQHWRDWLTKYNQSGNLVGGQSLTLQGAILRNGQDPAQLGPHQIDKEIVGGYLLLKAATLDEAISIIRTCPIFEADGYAEIREIMGASTKLINT
ncbi:MAG: hypothetical protein JWP57_1071 [Spirosoma sp.]|nr:hypothetical protein [Spirosoma sp.]